MGLNQNSSQSVDFENIFLICGRTDMRKGIDGLATIIQDEFKTIYIVTRYFCSLESARIGTNHYTLMVMVSL